MAKVCEVGEEKIWFTVHRRVHHCPFVCFMNMEHTYLTQAISVDLDFSELRIKFTRCQEGVSCTCAFDD